MDVPQALSSLQTVDYPQDKIEVIVARGRRPARQRNRAAAAASGDVLFFLDDDSHADRALFRRNVSFYSDPTVAGVGGPALPLPPRTTVEAASDLVLASIFGDYRGCKRFASRGSVRRASEDEIILCNLSMRRDVFESFHGFHDGLYPNEENALFQKVLDSGEDLHFVYVPDAVIRRPRPASLREFAAKLFRYGTGRFEQTLEEPSLVCALRMASVAFPLYWLCLPLLAYFTPWAFVPAALYAAGGLAMSGRIYLTVRSVKLAVAALALFPVMHFVYPAGILWAATVRQIVGRGLDEGEITVEKLKEFGSS